ncbi:putative signal transducing protein [Marinobacterium weihaiense]|uniref:DUF2007 domain-containing protein n=1 Tax=Marinobacterium weihaiense TaxID=2851016 RepID=A0ABS6M8S3_9GAMM|nr:DUF2007 domain-containing protein [Marinobacterium weihaiense]MBV0932635.1 DUF2007 domain-containing protein [Marinobacterium weihaiense]
MLVTIARYTYPYEAQIARALLDSEGIRAFVADEQTINMQWLYSDALGGVRLQVAAEDVERACQLLAEDREAPLLEQEGEDRPACPVCGSRNTAHHLIGRRWAFLMFLAIDFPLFRVRDGLRCHACGAITERPRH